MLIFDIRAEGVFAEDSRSENQVRRAAKRGASRALQRWAREDFLRRFGRQGFLRYGFTRRSPGYRKRQTKVFGVELPYRSPRVAGRHMTDELKGFSAFRLVSPRGDEGEVETVLRYRTPRIWNILANRADTKVYTDELLDFDRQGQREEGEQILADAQEFTMDELLASLSKTQMQRIGAA